MSDSTVAFQPVTPVRGAHKDRKVSGRYRHCSAQQSEAVCLVETPGCDQQTAIPRKRYPRHWKVAVRRAEFRTDSTLEVYPTTRIRSALRMFLICNIYSTLRLLAIDFRSTSLSRRILMREVIAPYVYRRKGGEGRTRGGGWTEVDKPVLIMDVNIQKERKKHG